MSNQPDIPTADAVEAFVASLRQRAVPLNTIKSYAHDLLLFVQEMPTDLTTVTSEQIQAFLIKNEQHSAATRRRRYSSLCSFYRWLLRHEVIDTNPMDHLDSIEQVQREPRPLAPEAVTKILQAIPASNLRDRTLFTLLYDTGIRVGEALSLLATDVDLSTDDEKIRVFGKGQRERTVMLTAAPESIRLLRRYLKQSRITSGSVFRGDPRYGGSPLPLEYSVAHYAWHKYCRAAEIQATIHQLRHSRASQLLQAGVPVTTVRKQLGHRNIQSTLLYAEVDQATIKQDLLIYQRRKGRQR
ncbi:tyrosine recombinase XerD [Ktedonobacteria bacterium brp13]|nr:tyrosine recombinase XerD [Ktedonobacteria bacterium brp13]